MKPRQKLNCLVATTFGGLLILSTGCSSGLFKKPDLGRLAFWSKNDLQLASRADDVPPPSAHFDPDRKDDAQSDKEMLQSSVEALVAEAQRNKEKQQDPIRKPYSLDTVDSKIGGRKKTDSDSNDFVLDEKLDQLQSATAYLQSATEGALKTTENRVKQTGEMIEDSAGSLAAKKNEIEQTVNVAGDKLQNQANDFVAGTQNAANSLVGTTEERIDRSVSAVKSSLDNSFQPPTAGRVANPYAAEASLADRNQNQQTRGADFPGRQPDTTSIQQSSFDGSFQRDNASLLQPVNDRNVLPEQAADVAAATMNYPTTPFGALRPRNRDQNVSAASLEIPAQLLNGNSTFSPGSTTPLRPVDSSR